LCRTGRRCTGHRCTDRRCTEYRCSGRRCSGRRYTGRRSVRHRCLRPRSFSSINLHFVGFRTRSLSPLRKRDRVRWEKHRQRRKPNFRFLNIRFHFDPTQRTRGTLIKPFLETHRSKNMSTRHLHGRLTIFLDHCHRNILVRQLLPMITHLGSIIFIPHVLDIRTSRALFFDVIVLHADITSSVAGGEGGNFDSTEMIYC
jgi:hypothetical protein